MGIKFHIFSKTSVLVLKRHQFSAQSVAKPAFQGEIDQAWLRPFNSNSYRGQEWVEFYIHSPVYAFFACTGANLYIERLLI